MRAVQKVLQPLGHTRVLNQVNHALQHKDLGLGRNLLRRHHRRQAQLQGRQIIHFHGQISQHQTGMGLLIGSKQRSSRCLGNSQGAAQCHGLIPSLQGLQASNLPDRAVIHHIGNGRLHGQKSVQIEGLLPLMVLMLQCQSRFEFRRVQRGRRIDVQQRIRTLSLLAVHHGTCSVRGQGRQRVGICGHRSARPIQIRIRQFLAQGQSTVLQGRAHKPDQTDRGHNDQDDQQDNHPGHLLLRLKCI